MGENERACEEKRMCGETVLGTEKEAPMNSSMKCQQPRCGRGGEREREREILEVVFAAAAAAAAATQTTGVGKRNGDTYFKVG